MKRKGDGLSVFWAMCFFMMFAALAAGNAAAATYYSSPSGSGSTCSSASPCSLTTGVGKLAAGDTLYLTNGTYNSNINVTTSGTSTSPITIKALNDGQAIVDGQGARIPLQINNRSYVDVEGIVFQNSSNSVVLSNYSNHITLRRVSAYNTADQNYHAFEFYYVTNSLIEDCVASGRSRVMYDMSECSYLTLRRNWGLYQQGVTYASYYGMGIQIYGSTNCIVENNLMVKDTSYASSYLAGIGIWSYYYNDAANNNTVIGNVVKNCNDYGYKVMSDPHQLSGNIFENNVSINSHIAFRQGAEADLLVQNFTAVGTASYDYYLSWENDGYTPDAGFSENGTLKNSAFLQGSYGIYIDPNAPYYAGLTHSYNNFYGISANYGGKAAQGSAETFANPSYNTSTYGNGAYLMVPTALQGKGQNGADIGAEVLYQYNNGVLTSTPLWPWPMEDRIFAETGVSPTWAANGGLWKTLDGVYAGSSSPSTPSTPTADTTAPSTPAGLSAAVVSSSQINVAWTPSTDNVGVAGYKVYRNGAQIATTATTSYSNTGLAAATTYSYTVATYDTAGNTSAQSAPVSATTTSTTTTTPTPQVTVSATQVAPGATVTVQVSGGNCGVQEWVALYLASNPDSSYSVNGNWQYLNGLQTPPTTGLCSATLKFVMPTTPGVYNFRYFAQNGYATRLAVSPNVTVVSSSDSTPPSTPTGLTATAASSSQINLSWKASTDNVGVAGYKVYRNGTQIATTTGASYSNTGLTASTTYTYTVAAYDAAGNVSAQSASASATTTRRQWKK